MGLFDAFSFKKDGVKVFSKEFFLDVLKEAREQIVEFAKKNMPGEEKKRNVDLILIAKIYAKVTEFGVKNKLVLWAVDKFVDFLPSITQLVYEFLKEKIENL